MTTIRASIGKDNACPTPTKIAYWSEAMVREFARQEPYLCPCGFWHNATIHKQTPGRKRQKKQWRDRVNAAARVNAATRPPWPDDVTLAAEVNAGIGKWKLIRKYGRTLGATQSKLQRLRDLGLLDPRQ